MVNKYCRLTKSAGQTKKLGSFLAKKILKTPAGQKAAIFGLEGDLGAGKTTFLQGFAKELGIKDKILSPTFVLIKRFKIPRAEPKVPARDGQDLRFSALPKVSSPLVNKYKNFYHIDCYRFKSPKEMSALDFKKIISNPENIIAAEWADKIKKILPEKTIWIKFKFIGKNQRRIKINGRKI